MLFKLKLKKEVEYFFALKCIIVLLSIYRLIGSQVHARTLQHHLCMLELQLFRLHLRSQDSETLGMGPINLCCKLSRGFLYMVKMTVVGLDLSKQERNWKMYQKNNGKQ